MSNYVFDPSIGELRPRAWLALTGLLVDLDWHHRHELEPAMAAASGMQESSCRSMLEDAKRAGLLERIPSGRIHPHRVRKIVYRIVEGAEDEVDTFDDRCRAVLRSPQVEAAAETEVLK